MPKVYLIYIHKHNTNLIVITINLPIYLYRIRRSSYLMSHDINLLILTKINKCERI